ncbi:MAG: hypothetical protein GX071_09515 [Gammaproteobacteria bacterium]|nr:hypothetical protein [Gammaproteobacteria bacterium]
MDAQEAAVVMLASEPVGCLGNFLFFSVPIEQSVRQLEFPVLQKNQFAALARFVLVMCGAESCSCYGVLPGFYFYCVYNKALAVPAFVIPFKSMAYV